jgi:hypothetical protein
LAASAFLVAGCSLADAGDGAPALLASKDVHSPFERSRLADPGLKGPFEIGFKVFQFLDTSRNGETGGRHIPTYVFYPVDPRAIGPATPPASYPLDTLYGLYPEAASAEFEELGVDRAYAAPRPSSAGPFPLLVFSSGWLVDANFYLYVGTRLASHGFVVAVLSHQGELGSPADTFDHIAMALFNRPRDVSFALSRLLERNRDRHGLLHGLIQPDRIAAGGHSLGGYTALVVGGAGDDAICDSTVVDSEWMGPPPPEACGSSAPDPRLRAVLYLDGSNQFLQFRELSRLRLPIQGIGQDPVSLGGPSGWGSWQARTQAAARSEHAYRVDVKHAVHQSFSNFCQVAPIYFQNGLIDQAYLDSTLDYACRATSPQIDGKPLLPSGEVQRLAMKIAIPFLKTFLAGDHRYSHMVDAEWVNAREQDVAFFETERGGTTHQGPGAVYLDPTWTDEFDYFLSPPAGY